jgi:hypothetical protein
MQPLNPSNARYLPMIEQKKTSELIETSLIYLLSAGVAVGAFLLISLLLILATD